jgi:hypothetical protein
VAKKNVNDEGSRPRKKPDGRWEARYWTETATGKKRRSVYGGTRKEAAEKLTKAKKAKDETPAFVPTDIMVGEFFEQYENAVRTPSSDAVSRRITI